MIDAIKNFFTKIVDGWRWICNEEQKFRNIRMKGHCIRNIKAEIIFSEHYSTNTIVLFAIEVSRVSILRLFRQNTENSFKDIQKYGRETSSLTGPLTTCGLFKMLLFYVKQQCIQFN